MDDAALAASLVRDAGSLAARMLADGLTVQHKSSISDVVSAADHAAEALVVARLRAQRPDDALVGEEGASADGATGRPGGIRTWYVDPVDGTYNFLSGLPSWCSAVGLTVDGEPVLGAIHQPSTGELWIGGTHVRFTCNGDALPRLADRDLASVSLATYLHPTTLPDAGLREPLLRALGGAATVRMLGSGSIELAAVAAGRLGAYLQADCKPWDWLPGAALVRAAGGTTAVVPVSGHRWHVAGPPRVVDRITDLLLS